MTLSLCMIVRDEADQIAECLQSVRNLVDESIVVDTGSADKTPDLARENGARVIAMEWCDDFSAARNRALEEATGTWILALDADERLFPRHFEAVRRLMAIQHARAVQVFTRSYTDDASLMNWQPIDVAHAEARGFCGYYDLPQVRLFRRDGRVRYEGIVHEMVAPSLARHSIPIYRADVVIHHYYEARPAEVRRARNQLIFDLSCLRTDGEAGNPEMWRQRAKAALALGDLDDAEQSFRRALELNPEMRSRYMHLGCVLLLKGKAEDACKLYQEALERFPDEPELVQSLGDALLAAGRHDDAREELSRSLELDPYLYQSLIGLGVLAMQAEHYEAAIDYFKRARSINSGADAPHVNLGMIYLKQGRAKEALGSLRRAFAINPKRWQTLAGIGSVLFDSGLHEEAAEWYEKATGTADCGPEVYVKLCACALALGRQEDARRWADKAAASDPAFAQLSAQITVNNP